MPDAEFTDETSAPDPSYGARGCVLFASLKHVFWRAPRRYEWLICALLPVVWLGFGATPIQLLLVLCGAALGVRGVELADYYGRNQWPHDQRKQQYPIKVYYAIWLLLLLSGLIKAFFVQLFTEPGETLIGIGIVAAFLAWLAPMMWSLDRVFKPWAQRGGDKVAPALVFVFLCGCWFFVSMFLLLHVTGKLTS